MFSTYLFDLDGTLIDSTDLIMESFRHTMRRHLGDVPDERAWRDGFGTPLRAQLAKFARNAGEADAMRSTYREYNHQHHDRLVRQYPGVRTALEVLRKRGVTLAIVTSKTRELAWRGLRWCALDEYFKVLVGVEDVTECKPNPEPVLTAIERVATDAAESLFIGDSPHDIEAGCAAGVRTAAALWGPFEADSFVSHRPHYWVSKPSEIPEL